MLKVLIADDHPIFRKGLIDIIQSKLQDCSISDVSNGKEAMDLLREEPFQITILDIDMPEMDGLEVCRQIRRENINTRVIILTMFKDEAIFNSALSLGVYGFLLKDHSGNDMIHCIDEVLLGKQYIGTGLEDKLKDHEVYLKRTKEIKEHLSTLTESELKTLQLVARNNTTKEIASKLFITPKSVENYRSRICKKLELPPGNNSLMKWIFEHKELLKNL